jgi:hypothetical protein
MPPKSESKSFETYKFASSRTEALQQRSDCMRYQAIMKSQRYHAMTTTYFSTYIFLLYIATGVVGFGNRQPVYLISCLHDFLYWAAI